MKKLITLLLCLSMILSINTIALASSDVKIKVNGTQLSDAQAILKDSATLLPVRSVSTALGCEVIWDNETKTASIDKDDTSVNITIGQKELTVNGKKQTISTPAQIISGRTYVPLRALGEALECDITWVNETKTVEITQLLDPSEYKVWYEVDEQGRIAVKTNINSNGWDGYTIVTALRLSDGRIDWDTEHRQKDGIIELHPRGFYSHHKSGTVIRSTEIYIFKGIIPELTDSMRNPYDKISAFSDQLVCQTTLSNPIRIKEDAKPIQFTALHVSYDDKTMKDTFTATIADKIAAIGEYDMKFIKSDHHGEWGTGFSRKSNTLVCWSNNGSIPYRQHAGTFQIEYYVYSMDNNGNITLTKNVSNKISHHDLIF